MVQDATGARHHMCFNTFKLDWDATGNLWFPLPRMVCITNQHLASLKSFCLNCFGFCLCRQVKGLLGNQLWATGIPDWPTENENHQQLYDCDHQSLIFYHEQAGSFFIKG